MSGSEAAEAIGHSQSVPGTTGREARAVRAVARSRTDPEQFGQVFGDYFSEIHGYVARRLGQDAADDIAAATFETAFVKRLGFNPALGTVRAWLYGITTRHIARRHRDEARRYRAMERIGAPAPEEGPEDAVASRVTATAELRRLAGRADNDGFDSLGALDHG
jgi:RNA polymerase sigma-70 factor (ECF subfamily)